MNSVSPLRYPGGKSCLYPFIRNILLLNKLILTDYCEPFAGGCGLALSLLFAGDVSDIHINDIDPAIWSFWHSTLHQTERLVEMVYEAEVTLDEHARQREIYEAGDWSDPLRLGFAAFFLNRTNRSGIIRGSGVIGGKKQDGNYKIDCRFTKDELVRRIRRIALYRQRIHLSRMDAIDFMHVKALTLPSSAFFCIDPPYFEKGAKLYTNSFTRDDHTRVAGAIQRLRQPYIVTYDDAPTIANLFSLRRRFRLNLPYSLQVKRVGTELVILSDRLRICDVGEGISKVSLMAYEGAIA